MTFRSRFFLLVLMGSIGVSERASGQSTSRIGGGLALGVTPNLAEGFSADQICADRSAISLSARATMALSKVIQLEALGETFKGPGIDCIDGLVPPAPPTGPYTRILDYYDGRMAGPPTALSLRAGWMLPGSGTLTVRPYVGIARLVGKDLTTPQAGLTVWGGGSQPRLLFEVEGWWYSVPKQHLEDEFFDGQLVRHSLKERDVRTFTAIIRLGFTSRVGRN